MFHSRRRRRAPRPRAAARRGGGSGRRGLPDSHRAGRASLRGLQGREPAAAGTGPADATSQDDIRRVVLRSPRVPKNLCFKSSQRPQTRRARL